MSDDPLRHYDALYDDGRQGITFHAQDSEAGWRATERLLEVVPAVLKQFRIASGPPQIALHVRDDRGLPKLLNPHDLADARRTLDTFAVSVDSIDVTYPSASSGVRVSSWTSFPRVWESKVNVLVVLESHPRTRETTNLRRRLADAIEAAYRSPTAQIAKTRPRTVQRSAAIAERKTTARDEPGFWAGHPPWESPGAKFVLGIAVTVIGGLILAWLLR